MAKIVVARSDYRATPEMSAHWKQLGSFLSHMRRMLGSEVALGIAMSRVSRELRKDIGPEEAAKVLHQLADQQQEMVKYDVEWD